jgi:predicted double-glycine peptidase
MRENSEQYAWCDFVGDGGRSPALLRRACWRLGTLTHLKPRTLASLIMVAWCATFSVTMGQAQQTEQQRHQHQQRQHQQRKAAQEKPQGPPPVTPPVRDPEHTFQLRVRDWLELKRRNIVMQRRDYSCGAAALATVGRYYWGDNVDEDLFLRALDSILTDEEIVDRIQNGLAMSDLRRAAVDVGYQAVVGKITYEQLLEVKVPVIVGISPEGHDHFVVFRGTDGMWVYVADPIRGNVRMPIQEFTKQWQENAVLAVHKAGAKVKTTSPLHVSWEEKQLGKTTDQVIRTQAQRQPAMRKPRLSR